MKRKDGQPTQSTAGTCQTDGCDKPIMARRLCRKHYRQQVPEPPRDRTVPDTCDECGKDYRRHTNTYSGCCPPCAKKRAGRILSDRAAAARAERPTTCPVYYASCTYCGTPHTRRTPYIPTRATYCTPSCATEAASVRRGYRPRQRSCERCETPIQWDRHRIHRYCTECKAVRHKENRKANKTGTHRHRAKQRGLPYVPIKPLTIYRRDHWICGICGLNVDPTLKFPNRLSASLDHVIPMARGGGHLPDNVQLAHWACNVRKRDTLTGRGVSIWNASIGAKSAGCGNEF